MYIYKTCKVCGETKWKSIKCDECGKEMPCEAIEIEFGFGHAMDGQGKWNFCTDVCIQKWLKREQDNRYKHRSQMVQRVLKSGDETIK